MVDSANVKATAAGAAQTAKESVNAKPATHTTSAGHSTTSGHATAAGGSHSKTTPAGGSKLEALAKTMEFKWFVAHALVVVNTLSTLVLFRAQKLAAFTYRAGFLAAFASFAVILFQKYGTSKPNVQVLIRDDNFQYAIATLVWLFTVRHILALLPLGIFSLFHVLTYSRSYLLPALGHPLDSPLIKRIDNVVKSYNEPLTVLAANFELALALQLLLAAVTLRRGSWFQLIFYVLFFRLRYATSAYTRHAVKAWEVRADQLLGHPALPPKAKHIWAEIKMQLARIPGPANKV